MRITPAAVSLVVVLSAASARADLAVGGDVSADARAFVFAPAYQGQSRDDDVSLRAEPEFTYKSTSGRSTITLRPFYRLDPIDSSRSHADLRQARYDYRGDHFSFGVGVGTFSWGVLESYRPTDILNQTDFVESYRGDAKLGQPFAQVGWEGEAWSARLYYLPYFRERTFPGTLGRLRFASNVDTGAVVYEDSLGPLMPSGAFQLSYRGGSIDMNLNLLSGLSREPRFVAELATGNVAPRYDLMQDASLDVQWVLGPVVVKGEGYVRLLTEQLTPFGGGGVGVDYMLPDLGKATVVLAAEFLGDQRPLDAPITLFRHDVFGGARVAFNDSASTELGAGAIVDVIDGTTFGRLELVRHFGDNWRASLDANLFLGPTGPIESSFRRDSYGGAHVAYFF